MSRMGFLDRLQTIVVTATVTSAMWIVVGTVYVGGDGGIVGRSIQADRSGTDSGDQAQSGAAGHFTIPVLGVTAAELTDTFGDDRGGRPHHAIDIMAPAGTPVVAAAPGTLEKLFVSDDGGNTIYVRSGDRRTVHYYAHLQAFARGLVEGQPVREGQQLGTVGSTGNANPAAPHLHFAVMRLAPDASWWDAAAPIDPFPLLQAGSSPQ